METFAGFAEQTDEQVGRLITALDTMGVRDNTLVIYIVGDNGASAEGGPEGTYNEMMALNGIVNTDAINAPHLEHWGDPTTFPHYAIGWAWAGDTPFQWTKQIASHYGGTTNGVVIRWPARYQSDRRRNSFAVHVRDRHRADRARGRRSCRSRNRSTERLSCRSTARRWRIRSTIQKLRRRTPRSTSRCSATAVSTTMAGPLRRAIPFRGYWCRTRRWRTTSGSCTTSPTTSVRRTTSRQKNPAKLKELQELFMKEAVQEPRIADRRPPRRAVQSDHRRPPGPDGHTHVVDGLPRHDRHERERVHQRQEPLVHDYRAGGTEGYKHTRRHHRAGRRVRRLDAVHEGRRRASRIQLLRGGTHQHRVDETDRCRQTRDQVRVRR